MRILATTKARNALYVGFGAVLALQVVDVITTTNILAAGGYEANPWARPFAAHGAAGLILQKAAASIVVVAAAVMAIRYTGRHAPRLLGLTYGTFAGAAAAVAAWYVLVVVHNAAVLS